MHRLGEYEVVRAIARGGMGSVFEVRHPTSNATYAAKVMLRADDMGSRERFKREAELLARCDRHPGVVKVHSIGEAPGGYLYMILDLVRGEDLGQVLTRQGQLEAKRAAKIALEIAEALAFIHELGIVHRDVKPSNVLLDEKGTCHLTDFGVATATDLQKLTKTGLFIGTLRFVAPEQAAGVKATSASDVFAVGCILYRALTGDYLAEDLDGTVYLAWLTGLSRAPSVRELAPETPEPLARIIARALEKDPTKRYPSGRELADDLAAFLDDRPVLASAASSRRRVLAFLLGISAILAGVTIWLALGHLRGGPSASAEPVAVAPTDPAMRVEQARKLIAAKDAKGALEAVAGLAENAAVLEVRGDAAMIASDWKGAAQTYSLAMAKDVRLRVKRCEAAALAGDEKTASSDLVPLLAAMPNDVRLAPALYRRALAGRDVAARRRDLEAGCALAPPPPAFARDVALAMNDIATDEAHAWGDGVTSRVALTEQDMENFRPIYGLLARAYAIENDLPKNGFANLLRLLRALTKTIEKKKIEHFARLILSDWPREPLWLYLLGHALQDGNERDKREALQCFELATDGYRAAPPNEEPEVKHLAGEIARNMVSLSWRLDIEPDYDRVAKMADRSEEGDAELQLAQILRDHKHFDGARATLARAKEMKTYKEGKLLAEHVILEEELALQWAEGKKAQVIKRVARYKGTPGWGNKLYARYA
ncbi:MAG: serine/threonine protein kinase, partial [Planctomycetota bacterium]